MFIFPTHLFNPSKVRTVIERKTLSGGVSLSGIEDTVITDGGGRWVITYSEIPLDDPEMQRFWEAWNGHLNGGNTDILVPMVSIETAPRPAQGKGFAMPSDIWADHHLFPTQVRFAAPYIEATATVSAALRATSIAITIARGSSLRGGEKFSVGERAYRIGKETSPGVFSIEPPLREPILAGTAINFDWPVVKCRSVPGQDWSVDVEYGRFGDAEITFAEVFP